LPGHGGHGHGPALRRPAGPRPDEELRRLPGGGVLEGALPGGGAVLLHQPQARRRRGAGGGAGGRDGVEQPLRPRLRHRGPGAGRQRGRRVDPAADLGGAGHRAGGAGGAGAAPDRPLGAAMIGAQERAPARPGLLRLRPFWPAALPALVALAGLLGPFGAGGEGLTGALAAPLAALLALALLPALHGGAWVVPAATPFALAAAFLALLAQRALPSVAGWGYWAVLGGALLAAVAATARVSVIDLQGHDPAWQHRLQRALPAAAVAFLLLLAWEGLVVGSRVPKGIFPRVSDIGAALVSSWSVLMADAYLTFVREVAFGLGVGLLFGFLVGTAVAFTPFLQRGFL